MSVPRGNNVECKNWAVFVFSGVLPSHNIKAPLATNNWPTTNFYSRYNLCGWNLNVAWIVLK